MALTISGNVYGFGDNRCSQLAIDVQYETVKYPSWIHAFTGRRVLDISCGPMHAAASKKLYFPLYF